MSLMLRKHRLFHALIALVLAYAVYGLFDRYQVPRVLGLYWGQDTIEQCLLKKSVTQETGQPFAICRTWSERDGEFLKAIVYDGSDRIARGSDNLPIHWETKVEACRDGSKTTMFCASKFVSHSLMNHLYVVDFVH